MMNKFIIIFFLQVLFLICLNNYSERIYGNNNIYINGVNGVSINGGGLEFDYSIINQKLVYLQLSIADYLKKFNKVEYKYKVILFFVSFYFFIGYYYNRLASRIVNSNLYIFLANTNELEMIAMMNKIESDINFDFILNIKKVKQDIDYLFCIRYYVYLFIFFPFCHNDLKKIMFKIHSLYNSMDMFNSLIMKD